MDNRPSFLRFSGRQIGLPRRSWAEAGQASKLLLVLAVVVLVAVLITFLVMKTATKPPAPPPTPVVTVPVPVYEKTLDNIRFVFISALDKGTILKLNERCGIKE